MTTTQKVCVNKSAVKNFLVSSKSINGVCANALGFIDKVILKGGNESLKFKLDESFDFDLPPF